VYSLGTWFVSGNICINTTHKGDDDDDDDDNDNNNNNNNNNNNKNTPTLIKIIRIFTNE
jgi:hypothetical protein